MKQSKVKKNKKHSSAEGATMEDWFADIGFDEEERATKGPPSKKKKIGSRARTVYK